MAARCLEGVMSKNSIISLDAEDIEALFKKKFIWSTFYTSASCSVDLFAAINEAMNKSFTKELSLFNLKHLLVYIEISKEFYGIKDMCQAINFICVRIGIEKHIVNFGVGLSGKNEKINLTFLVAE
jgi:cell division GTPase FtsZ